MRSRILSSAETLSRDCTVPLKRPGTVPGSTIDTVVDVIIYLHFCTIVLVFFRVPGAWSPGVNRESRTVNNKQNKSIRPKAFLDCTSVQGANRDTVSTFSHSFIIDCIRSPSFVGLFDHKERRQLFAATTPHTHAYNSIVDAIEELQHNPSTHSMRSTHSPAKK